MGRVSVVVRADRSRLRNAGRRRSMLLRRARQTVPTRRHVPAHRIAEPGALAPALRQTGADVAARVVKPREQPAPSGLAWRFCGHEEQSKLCWAGASAELNPHRLTRGQPRVKKVDPGPVGPQALEARLTTSPGIAALLHLEPGCHAATRPRSLEPASRIRRDAKRATRWSGREIARAAACGTGAVRTWRRGGRARPALLTSRPRSSTMIRSAAIVGGRWAVTTDV